MHQVGSALAGEPGAVCSRQRDADSNPHPGPALL